MFTALIIFIGSFIVEILLLIFTSPETSNGQLNHFWITILSINSAVLLGSLFSLLLMFIYWTFKLKSDLTNKTHYRRGIIFGILIFGLLITKLYSILDTFIILLLVFTTTTVEVILSSKKE